MEYTHTQAVNRLKDINDELERLDAKDTLTPEDETYWEDLVREIAEVEDHAKTLVRKADLERARLSAAVSPRSGLKIERGAEFGSDNGELDRDISDSAQLDGESRYKNPWDLSEMRTFNRGPGEIGGELRARALSAIESMKGMNQSRREAATNIIEEFDNTRGDLSRQALLTSRAAYVSAFWKASRGDFALSAEESQAVSEVRAMSLTDSAGGYLVPFQLDPTVIITSAGTRNDIRQVARQVVATGDVWNGVSSGAVSWSYDAEAAEVSDDATTFAQPAITIYKAAGFVPISREALEDEANVAMEVGRLLAFGKDTLEATQFSTGSGSAPQGIVTALAGTASEINAATDDAFAIADVYTIQGALPARHRANASWLANNSIYNLIRRFDTSGGAGLWTTLGNDRPPELLGRRALESEGMDATVTTTGAVSNFILIYGDFSNYVIADRIGMTVDFIPHLFHTTTNRPSGSSGWYAHIRHGADSVNDDAFRLLDAPSAA